MPRCWNLGDYQLLWWPRRTLYFSRRNFVCYEWIVYLWPLELRHFYPSIAPGRW